MINSVGHANGSLSAVPNAVKGLPPARFEPPGIGVRT